MAQVNTFQAIHDLLKNSPKSLAPLEIKSRLILKHGVVLTQPDILQILGSHPAAFSKFDDNLRWRIRK